MEKISMGRKKDLNDLIYFIPFKEDKYKFVTKGFRYFSFLEEKEDFVKIPLQENKKEDEKEATDISDKILEKIKDQKPQLSLLLQVLTDEKRFIAN